MLEVSSHARLLLKQKSLKNRTDDDSGKPAYVQIPLTSAKHLLSLHVGEWIPLIVEIRRDSETSRDRKRFIMLQVAL